VRPNFKKISEAYGIDAFEVKDIDMIGNLMKYMLKDDNPALMDMGDRLFSKCSCKI